MKRPALFLIINVFVGVNCLSHAAALTGGFGGVAARQQPAAQQDKRLDEKIEPRLPGKTVDEQVAEAFANSIREALRKPAEGETRVRGQLTRIDCVSGGLVFTLKAGKRLLKLRREGFDGLHLMAFTPNATGGELTCAVRKPSDEVVATYRPVAPVAAAARPRTDGALVALEFVPANFQLEAAKAAPRRPRN